MDLICTVEKVHVNGNVTISKGTTERLNIRKIKPYKPPANQNWKY